MAAPLATKPTIAFNRMVSLLLVAAIVGSASVLVHREFFAEPPEPSVPPPQYVSDWRSIRAAAVEIDTNAPVQIIEFLDLQCPACRGYDTILKRVVRRAEGRVSLGYVHLPLPIHKHALSAARAAECARTQGRFREFVAGVFAKQQMLGRVSLATLGRDAQIADVPTFERCAQDTTPVLAVQEGVRVAEQFDVHSTPTILVNGWRYSGLPGERTLRRFAAELVAGKVTPPASAQQRNVVMPTRRVEGGVARLHHNSAAFVTAPQLTLSAQPVMVAGGADGDPAYDLTDVRHVQILSDGRIAALNQRVPTVMIFGTDGRPQRMIGRRGRGPGELRGASDVVRVKGDTLLLLDPGNMRLNWLLADRGVSRSAAVESRIPEAAFSLAGTLPNGWVILTAVGRVENMPLGTRSRSLTPVVALPPGQPGKVIARVPDVETVAVQTRYEGSLGIETLVLGFSRLAHVVVLDTSIVVGDGNGYRIEFRNREGRLESILDADIPRRAVTSAMRQALIAEQLERLAAYRERPRDPKESQRLIREQPFTDSMPPYSALFTSPHSTLWVLDPLAPTDTVWTATAFRQDGAIVARVRAVRRGEPIAFGDSTVVVRRVDNDGVVSFAVHRLIASR